MAVNGLENVSQKCTSSAGFMIALVYSTPENSPAWPSLHLATAQRYRQTA
jgi:hypothetical protein